MMKNSESTRELAEALLAAQIAFQPVIKERTAEVRGTTKNNKEYRYDYKYADLAAVLDACIECLQKNNVLLQQEPITEGTKVSVTTRLTHTKSGEWQEFSPLTLEAGGGGPQAIGSAITYARRYQLTSILGVAPEDDDAASAQAAYEKSQQRQPPKTQSSQKPGQQKPPAQQQQQQTQTQQKSQPPAEVSVYQKIVEGLKKHGINKSDEARLVLNWVTREAFGTADPLEAIKDPVTAKATLTRMAEESKVVPAHMWLQYAQAWQQHLNEPANNNPPFPE